MTPATFASMHPSLGNLQSTEPLPGPFARLDDDLLLHVVSILGFNDRCTPRMLWGCVLNITI